jgi:CheY-like chemotaxis protein
VPHESPTVVLVDDHEDSAAMYAIGLLTMGFQSVTAASAEDGFERVCRLKSNVVVVLVSLAGMSGLDLTHRLRGDARTRGARIIVLAGHALGGIKDKAEAAGCDRFLVKPCLPDVLALEIRNVLHQREAARCAVGSEMSSQTAPRENALSAAARSSSPVVIRFSPLG